MTAESKTHLVFKPTKARYLWLHKRHLRLVGSSVAMKGSVSTQGGASSGISPPLIIFTGSCPCSPGPKGFQLSPLPHVTFPGALRRQKIQGRADNIRGWGAHTLDPPEVSLLMELSWGPRLRRGKLHCCLHHPPQANCFPFRWASYPEKPPWSQCRG